jgi:hypothetical protein
MFGLKTLKILGLTALMNLSGVFSLQSLAEEIDPKALLKGMSDEIAGLERFVVRSEAHIDTRLPAGQIIQHTSDVTLRIHRPNAMRLTLSTINGRKELYFSNGLLTLFSDIQKFYAQQKVEGDIEAAVDFAVNDVGIDLPMLDFLSNNIASRMQQDADEVQYLGQDLVDGSRHHHIGIRLPEVDVQIWVASTGKPLPGKMVLSAKWEGGAPRTVLFFTWETEPDFPAESVKFSPPADAKKIEFLLEPSE